MKKRRNYLDYVPYLSENISSELTNENIISIKIENNGPINYIFQKLFKKPKFTTIDLDKYGSFIWNNINGTNTIFDISLLLQKKYGSETEPLFNRIVYFINILETNKIIKLKYF